MWRARVRRRTIGLVRRPALIVAATEGQAEVVAYLLGRPGINIEAKTEKGDRAINFACQRGDLEVTKQLVAAGARLEAQANDEVGALASAAWGGHLQVVKYLVEEAGADENRAGRYGWTPLICAAKAGQADVVASLLARPGINVNAKTGQLTALNYACRRGHLEVVKLLVAAGARLEAQASDEMGALASATWRGHLQVVKYLVEEAGADENRAAPGGLLPLECAAKQGHADVVAYLLGRPGINANAKTGQLTALNYACRRGNLEVVKLLVAAGARLEAQASDEEGALPSAAWGGHLQVVKYLVEEAGADENSADPGGRMPLICAAHEGRADVVAYLLSRPGINIETKTGQLTALNIACRRGHLGVVNLLVAAGARLEAQASDEEGALTSAVWRGQLQVVKYLVEEVGADENRAAPGGWTPLIHAATQGHGDVVAYLLGRPGVNADAKTGQLTALNIACKSGHLGVVKLLVAAGARLEAQASDEVGALASAACNGQLEVVKYLVEEAGADENRVATGGWTPLISAADQGHEDVVAYLLGRPGINIDAKKGRLTALNYACQIGHLGVVKLLVGAGARLEAQASDERSALPSAACKGQLQVVKYLVEEAGADVNRAPPGASTPLVYATMHGQADVVAYLLGRPGINIHAQGPTGSKALDIACREGHLEVVQVLLEAPGREGLEEKDRLGRTALHHAVASVNKELVAFLLSIGAQASTKDTHKQETPLMLACSGGKLDMAQVLLKHTGGLHLSERNSEGRTALHLAATSTANGLSSDMVRALLLAGADPSITDNEGRTPRQAAQQDAEHSPCVETFEWWDHEQERAYVLYRARCLHDVSARQQSAPAAPVPEYLAARVARSPASWFPFARRAGCALPTLDVTTETKRGTKRRRAEDGEAEDEQEEGGAVRDFVMAGLNEELFRELLEGFHGLGRNTGAVAQGAGDGRTWLTVIQELLGR